MRYLLIIILLSSCSPEWHLGRAIKKGIKPETSIVTKTDTLYVGTVSDSLTQIVVVKTEKVKSDCDSLLKANPVKETFYIRKIQKEVCAGVSIDSVYQIPFVFQDSTYFIPVHVIISSDGGEFKWKIKGQEFSVPVKTETAVNKYLYGIKWWWLLIVACIGAFFGFLIERLK